MWRAAQCGRVCVLQASVPGSVCAACVCAMQTCWCAPAPRLWECDPMQGPGCWSILRGRVHRRMYGETCLCACLSMLSEHTPVHACVCCRPVCVHVHRCGHVSVCMDVCGHVSVSISVCCGSVSECLLCTCRRAKAAQFSRAWLCALLWPVGRLCHTQSHLAGK